MPRPTQKELLTKALLARGYVLGTGRADRSTKYVTFVSTPTARSLLKVADDGTVAPHSIFLGKAGAFRFSSTGKAAYKSCLTKSNFSVAKYLKLEVSV
jgi:hypothetical protein